MSQTKLLMETLRLADGGRVACTVETPTGERLEGLIEQTFFEEFAAAPSSLSAKRQLQIIQDNAEYLSAEAERQWRAGQRALVIR